MQGKENKAIFLNEASVLQAARKLHFVTNSHGCLLAIKEGTSMI